MNFEISNLCPITKNHACFKTESLETRLEHESLIHNLEDAHPAGAPSGASIASAGRLAGVSTGFGAMSGW